MYRPLEQLVEAVARSVQLVRRLVSAPHLVQNLILAHRHGIEPGANVHHMVNHVFARLEIEELREIVILLMGQPTYVTHEFRLADFAVGGHVDLGAVARRKNQEFVKRRMAERIRLHIHRDVELLADCNFGHLVAHAGHVNLAHGSKIEKINVAGRHNRGCH